MTFDDSQTGNPSTSDDPSCVRCLRYLLGELEATEAAAFEQELSHSSELGDELLQQADLLCQLSASRSVQTVEPARAGLGESPVKLFVTIAALAACLLIMVGGFYSFNRERSVARIDREDAVPNAVDHTRVIADTTASEASLIAQAWATSRNNVEIAPDSVAHEFEYELVSTSEDLISDHSGFSWMVHGLTTDADSSVDAGTSDG